MLRRERYCSNRLSIRLDSSVVFMRASVELVLLAPGMVALEVGVFCRILRIRAGSRVSVKGFGGN